MNGVPLFVFLTLRLLVAEFATICASDKVVLSSRSGTIAPPSTRGSSSHVYDILLVVEFVLMGLPLIVE